MYRLFLLTCLITTAAFGHPPQDLKYCDAQNGQHLEQVPEGYRLVLEPGTGDDDGCRAKLLDPDGKVRWQSSGWIMRFPVAPLDITNDGHPDLIVEDYSGGAHCCFTYLILSPQPTPALVRVIENQTSVDFEKRWKNKNVITTYDGAYDYFITSHAFSFMPPVHLLLEGRRLIDISGEPEFRKREAGTRPPGLGRQMAAAGRCGDG